MAEMSMADNPLVLLMREKREAEEAEREAARGGKHGKMGERLTVAAQMARMVKQMKSGSAPRPRSAVYGGVGGGRDAQDAHEGKKGEKSARPGTAKRAPSWVVPTQDPALRRASRVVVSGNPRAASAWRGGAGGQGLRVHNAPALPLRREEAAGGEAPAPTVEYARPTASSASDEEAGAAEAPDADSPPRRPQSAGRSLGRPAAGEVTLLPGRKLDPSTWHFGRQGAGGLGGDRSRGGGSSASGPRQFLPAGHPMRPQSARVLSRWESEAEHRARVREMAKTREAHAREAKEAHKVEMRQAREVSQKYARRLARRRKAEDVVLLLGEQRWVEESKRRERRYKKNVDRGRVQGPSQRHVDEMRVIKETYLPRALKSLAEAPPISDMEVSMFQLTAPPPVELQKYMTTMHLSSQSSVRNVPDLINEARGTPRGTPRDGSKPLGTPRHQRS